MPEVARAADALRQLLDPKAPEPLLSEAQRRLLIREVWREAKVGAFVDPRELAFRLGIGCYFYVPGQADPHPKPNTVACPWILDPRERHWHVWLRLSPVLLERARLVHNESDALLLAYDFVAPLEVAKWGLERVMREQLHCPESILKLVVEARAAGLHSSKG